MATSAKRISLQATTHSLADFHQFVDRVLTDAAIPADVAKPIAQALDEAIASVVWAAEDALQTADNPGAEAAHHIQLELDADATRFKAVIAEGSRDYEMPGPDTTAAFEREAARVRQHEFSMRLLASVFDEIDYAFKKGFQNELTLVKFL